ncbi:MAG: hypothetical protein ACOCTT_01025 [archaeon]
MEETSGLTIIAAILLFLAILTVFTKPFEEIEEGKVVSANNITECEDLNSNSSFTDTIKCTYKTTTSYLDITNLNSDYEVLNTVYKVLGSILFLYLVLNIVVPLLRGLLSG